MERQQLEQHELNLERLRIKLNGISQNGGAEGALADALDVVVSAVKAMIVDQLQAGAHGAAVRELIDGKPPAPRMTIDDPVCEPVGSKVESGGKLNPGEVDPRD